MAQSVPAAPKLELVEATETSITVQFQPIEDRSDLSYVLQWKEYPDSWDGCASQKAEGAAPAAAKIEIAPLNPGSTYCVRLALAVAATPPGEVASTGPEMVVDTEQVSCTPQQKGCCAVL